MVDVNNAKKRHTILVVDDATENIDVLNGMLNPSYRIKVALNGGMALKIAQSKDKPDLILLDVMMPGIDGYEVCRRLKGDPETANIPIIFVTAKSEETDETKGFELGAADYISKPIVPSIVEARVKTHLALYNQQQTLEERVRERTAQLSETQLEIVRRLGRAAEFKDNETGMHVIRMSHYAHILALGLGMCVEDAELLLHAAPMHDVGKIGIPDRILLKPGPLDEEEFALMRKHPKFGYDIIGEHASRLLQMARQVALTHHERWNGKGYPGGLRGEEIPLEGRLVAIADVFDALTSARPYKAAWPLDKTLDLLRRESGEHFEPRIVDQFFVCLPDIIKIKERYTEEAEEVSLLDQDSRF